MYISKKIKELEVKTNTKWKRVVGWENFYLINEYGLLYKLDFDRFSNGSPKDNGYIRTSLCINGKTKDMYIHRLVAQAFIPNPDKKDEVNHIDGDKTNNHINNLEWVTKSENGLHRFRVLGHKTANSKPTKIINLETNEVMYFDSLSKASKFINGKRTSGVDYVLKSGKIYKKKYKIESI